MSIAIYGGDGWWYVSEGGWVVNCCYTLWGAKFAAKRLHRQHQRAALAQPEKRRTRRFVLDEKGKSFVEQ